MIEIQNIEKITGMYLTSGRWIVETGDYTDTLRNMPVYYKFVINSTGDGEKANQRQTIVLSRKPGNIYNPNDSMVKGKYEMFNMGLQMSTSIYLNMSEIRNLNDILEYLQIVMDRTIYFYDNSN